MAYIQVGGGADGAADAAPSPSRCALGRRSQAHVRTDKQNKLTGLPKSIEELFGKRRRNGANRADCRGKPPSKRSLRRRESAAVAEPSPLTRLGIGCRFSRRAWLSFIGFYRCCLYRYKVARYVTFGSMAITSGLTCPIYSPSTQHPKLSKSKIFLSSRPYGQTISSSIMSVTKY